MMSATLSRGLAVQARTIAALIVREMHTRFGRDNIGYLWIFVEPSLLTIGVTSVHHLIGIHLPPGMLPAPFYIAGYTGYMLFRGLINRAGTTVEANGTLLFHRQVTLVDLVVARALLEAAALITSSIALLGVCAYFGSGVMVAKPLVFLGGWLLNVWFVTAMSMIVLTLCVRFPVVERIVHPLTYLALPISGAFTSFETIPGVFRSILVWVPLAQIQEIIREGVFENFSSLYTSPLYVVVWCVGLTLIGMAGLRLARKWVVLE
ncbi:ABC transporter permease [Caballeronia cordobensis]|uniref:ABC transporter permease n=1 Tax=Caballeronia cordobensis TaxID=1353886 RepID=UPI0006AD5E6B|nr:ABC transporter permease [Caballeronia cordobensis]